MKSEKLLLTMNVLNLEIKIPVPGNTVLVSSDHKYKCKAQNGNILCDLMNLLS